ncbi:hypothetical protein ACFOTA_08655 [Chitinophaga sp. GCM10012297]|uniref:PKD domain-containing protein n=1 Tax=Chitinophaga chungangae TaxID=2821488 RepID=A0ABS3YD87_9BACT|nr:hypothetical protein [Chitinophaga chungangae]MBO9152273.1 hypothetical protein [Chitinophaga chungangae]
MINKKYNPILALALCASMAACKKGDPVEITTLSKAGREFYFGERVSVWAGVEGERKDITYSWSATGGTFDGWRTQDLFENLWIAPAVPGEYTVTATAKDGKYTSTRSTTMTVSRYFFDEFQDNFTTTGSGWSESNTDRSVKADTDPAKSTIEISNKSTSSPNLRRSLNLAELKIPFSVSAQFGWKKYFRPNSAITFSMYFVQPTAHPNYPFLKEIRWEIFPTVDPATTDNYQVRLVTNVPSNTSGDQFSANSNTTATLPKPLPLINPVKGRVPALSIAKDVEKKITFSVDAGHVFHAYIDGQLWFTSNGLKEWLDYCKTTYSGFEDPIAKEFRVAFPAKANNNETVSTIFLNSVYIVNDGSILK